MKTNCWLILGMTMGAGALAQNNTNTLPPIPAPIVSPAAEVSPTATETNAPPTKAAKHKKHPVAPKRVALDEPTVALVSGPAEAAADDVNVRGQAGLKGEVVAHLNRGDVVTVMSQINLDKHEVGEPAQWAKIALPANTHVWVSSKFIDATSKTVSSRKLNLRAGPGENYSVLGVIEHGTAVNELATKGDWTQIDPPTDAYAFVAAMFLKQEAPGNLAVNPSTANPAPSTESAPATTPAPMETSTPTPTPTPTPVAEMPPVVTGPSTAAPAAGNNPSAPMVMDNNAPPMVGGNLPPRIVSHEGIVGPVGSIIAPTAYELYDPDTRQEINYLYTTSTNLDIGRYNGMRIVVTGEESIAERWTNTPLLTIQRIIVLQTNAIPKVYYPSPRQQRH
jgi:SH3-like domain-containing protein